MVIKLLKVNNDQYDTLYKSYYNSKLIGLIGLRKNTLIYHLLESYQKFKIFRKIFHKFILLTKPTQLYAKPYKNDLFIRLGFVKHGKYYKYHTQFHDIMHRDYPYLKYFLTIDKIHNMLLCLKNYTPDLNKNTNYLLEIKLDYIKDKYINTITDYFSDSCRVKCVFKQGISSPYDYYQKNKGDLILQSLTDNQFNIDKFENIIFYNEESKFCNNFQTSIVVSIYKYLNAKSVFDSSAGWGDRLIGAIALDIAYVGVDPSKCLKPIYENIIQTLAPNNPKYRILNTGIEEVDTNTISQVDLCFSSPPFFNLEIYETDNNEQSITSYKSLGEWERNFMVTLIEQNIKVLKPGGYFAIYILNYSYTMNYLKNHKLLKYKGIISFSTPKIRKIFLYQKIQK